MASLRDTVKDYQEALRDGIAWVAFWKEGRSWNAEYFHLEMSDILYPEDRSRMEEIKQADPAAVVVNGYYSGYLGEDMSLDELTAGVRRHYENGYSNIGEFIEAHDDRLPPELIEEARAAAHAAGLPFSEKAYRDGEEPDPYLFDGSMSMEDYELMHRMIEKERSEHMEQPILSGYLSNLGKYTEGRPAGEWVSFPTTAEHLKEVFAVADRIFNDQIVEKYLSNEQIRPYVSNLNRMEIGNIKSTASDGISSPVDWSKFRKQIVQHLPQDVVDPATQEDGMYSFGSDQPAALNLLGLIDTGSSSPYLLPVSSYNRLLDAAGEEQISLGNNEVVYYLNPDFLGNAQDETVTLLNQIAADAQANNEASLSINERPFYLVPSVPMKGLTADENIKIITALIVSDEIYSEFVNSDTCMVYWNFCIPNELVETKGLMLPIMEARDLLKPSGLYYESYLNNFGRQLFYVISGSYTTLYMGFMFLIIACALLALQFLTQMQTTKSRYLTLSILGARREQIKRSINQQVLWYFLLPLILACISGAVGIYAMQLYLYSGAAHLEQS
ncbi:FtsX-like permease family protein [Blautia parvula]|uniref:ABC transporter permease n=1 Tax=Blautia parvula TaxID=2877527 RepID=A0ABQ0BNH3_9FIRM